MRLGWPRKHCALNRTILPDPPLLYDNVCATFLRGRFAQPTGSATRPMDLLPRGMSFPFAVSCLTILAASSPLSLAA